MRGKVSVGGEDGGGASIAEAKAAGGTRHRDPHPGGEFAALVCSSFRHRSKESFNRDHGAITDEPMAALVLRRIEVVGYIQNDIVASLFAAEEI